MKKIPILNVVLMGLVFCFATMCFAEPVPVSVNGQAQKKSGFERIVRKPVFQIFQKATENNKLELRIKRCVQGPVLDENGDGHCRMYNMCSTYTVPEEGATFYSIYYFRIKSAEGWGEWKKTFTGGIFQWSQEDADLFYIEFTNTLLEDLDGDIPPSRAQFKEELYSVDEDGTSTLMDEFETSENGRKYWSVSLVESKNHDVIKD